MNKKMVVPIAVLMALAICAKPNRASATANDGDAFYVYHDKGDRLNHFIPSGWMGDYGDLKINDADSASPEEGKTSIKVTYTAEAKQGAGWAGIYWQNPANNWGEKAGGYDLTGYKRLTFWAKGTRTDKKPVVINEFKIGGITGEHGDSDSATLGPIELTGKWQKYTIDLADKNLSNIIGGFCWSTSRDNNPSGFELYLDEIRYEK